MHKSVEPLSDHPLFRALVLMGGSLALGCGGVAQSEAPGGVSGRPSGGADNGAAAGTTSVGGREGIPDIAAGGATQTTSAGGSAGTNAADFYDPACPYAQWDCSGLTSGSLCYFSLNSKDDPIAAGCTCDSTRPTSASACKADEAFVCRQAYPPYVEAQPYPSTWDGSLHIECSCVHIATPSADTCSGLCIKTFAGAGASQCRLPSSSTCNDQGVCTATSADVLRQDGIMCGCADIGLK